MVMPSEAGGYAGGPQKATPEQLRAAADGLLQGSRMNVWYDAAVAYVRLGRSAAEAAAEADRFLAEFDARVVSPTKAVFGKA
jgi:hypothetical protein